MSIDSVLLAFLGLIAAWCSLALFKQFEDRWTRLLLAYLGSAIWFVIGMGSFDVVLEDKTTAEPVMPMVIVCFVLGAIVFLFATHDLLFGAVEEVQDREAAKRL